MPMKRNNSHHEWNLCFSSLSNICTKAQHFRYWQMLVGSEYSVTTDFKHLFLQKGFSYTFLFSYAFNRIYVAIYSEHVSIFQSDFKFCVSKDQVYQDTKSGISNFLFKPVLIYMI